MDLDLIGQIFSHLKDETPFYFKKSFEVEVDTFIMDQ
jgi:hypothetical protein